MGLICKKEQQKTILLFAILGYVTLDKNNIYSTLPVTKL
jgi:hypothetical protein